MNFPQNAADPGPSSGRLPSDPRSYPIVGPDGKLQVNRAAAEPALSARSAAQEPAAS